MRPWRERQASGCLGCPPRREKVHRSRGRVRTSPWLPGPLAAERKGVQHPGRGSQNFWLPGKNKASAPHTQQHLPTAPRPPCSRTELKANRYSIGLTYLKNRVTTNQKHTLDSQKSKRREHKHKVKGSPQWKPQKERERDIEVTQKSTGKQNFKWQ